MTEFVCEFVSVVCAEPVCAWKCQQDVAGEAVAAEEEAAAAVVADGHPNDTPGTRGESCAEQTAFFLTFAVAVI